jgi:glycerophosphoryl diester phosphodiesterase
MHSTELIAHRGYSSKYPENTLASIEAALSTGAKFIEFDIQMMADDEFVLMHDDNLKRSSGINKSVFSLTRSTVKNFTADYYSTFSGQFSGIKIPLLDHALSLIKQFPEAHLLIEIKEKSLLEFGVEYVMKRLLPELKSIQNRCYIISFNAEAIEYTKNNSDYKTGFVLHSYDEDSYQQAKKLNPDMLICNYRKLPELKASGSFPENTLWSGDWLWVLYLIDNAQLALNYANAGVHFIETDHIGLLLQNEQFKQQ